MGIWSSKDTDQTLNLSRLTPTATCICSVRVRYVGDQAFLLKMFINNIRAKSKLATSAATFLKWEVYIFCFLQSESWAGRSLQNAFFLPPRTCSSCGAELTVGALLSIATWPVEGNLSAAVTICFPLPFIHLSIHLSIPDSSQCLVFLRCLSFPALSLLPSKPKGLSRMSCLSPFSPSLLLNLGWKLCCTHRLFSGYLQRKCVCVLDSVHSKRKKMTNLYVDS